MTLQSLQSSEVYAIVSPKGNLLLTFGSPTEAKIYLQKAQSSQLRIVKITTSYEEVPA